MTRLLAVAAVVALAACGGGGAGQGVSPAPSTPATTRVSTPPVTQAPSETPSPVGKHGSARVKHDSVEQAWAERACETTRDLDGKVVGWMATFQDAEEQSRQYRIGITDSRRYVQIRLRGYTGAGTYPSERVSVRFADNASTPSYQTGFGTLGQTLVLRDGGRAGTYRSRTLTVDFTCDPADDTSTKPGAAVAEDPAPGQAYVVRPEGAAFVFQGVRCTRSGPDTSITAGTFPHFFRVLTRAEPGAEAGGRVLFGVHGIVIQFGDTGTRVRVEGDPVTAGTFRYSPSGPNATTDLTRGAFACG